MTTALEITKVSKIYGKGDNAVKAVDQVSLDVKAGEFIALVGPSGSGKTSLLAMLAALLSPSEGSIFIDNSDLRKMAEKERTRFRREKIGFTFQANNLVPYLTALENVSLMLKLNNVGNKESIQKAEQILVRLGLEDRLSSFPRQLSGGQKQMVAIARALVHNPSLVLADEPTASLDTDRAYQVVKTFSDLIHEQGRAGIMVTHDLRMTKHVDKIVQMVDGKIVNIISNQIEIEALSANDSFGMPIQIPQNTSSQLNIPLAPPPTVSTPARV